MTNNRPCFYALIEQNCSVLSFPHKRESHILALDRKASEFPAYAGMTLDCSVGAFLTVGVSYFIYIFLIQI
jgi:hypothetical protein